MGALYSRIRCPSDSSGAPSNCSEIRRVGGVLLPIQRDPTTSASAVAAAGPVPDIRCEIGHVQSRTDLEGR